MRSDAKKPLKSKKTQLLYYFKGCVIPIGSAPRLTETHLLAPYSLSAQATYKALRELYFEAEFSL